VNPVAFGLLANAAGTGASNPLLTGYFDQFQAGITNLSGTASLPLARLIWNRAVPGADPLSVTQNLVATVSPGGNVQQSVIVAEAPVVATQTIQVSAVQQTDSEGSSVTYQGVFALTNSQLPGTEVSISANQLPLAGGLTPFQVQVFNRAYVNMQFIVERANGSQPGDVYISVQNSLGQEVSRTPYQGTPPGTTFLPDGTAYVNIAPGASVQFTVPNVLVPAALVGTEMSPSKPWSAPTTAKSALRLNSLPARCLGAWSPAWRKRHTTARPKPTSSFTPMVIRSSSPGRPSPAPPDCPFPMRP
jgi:hypothetical protein